MFDVFFDIVEREPDPPAGIYAAGERRRDDFFARFRGSVTLRIEPFIACFQVYVSQGGG
jgi:hypothetical protein